MPLTNFVFGSSIVRAIRISQKIRIIFFSQHKYLSIRIRIISFTLLCISVIDCD